MIELLDARSSTDPLLIDVTRSGGLSVCALTIIAAPNTPATLGSIRIEGVRIATADEETGRFELDVRDCRIFGSLVWDAEVESGYLGLHGCEVVGSPIALRGSSADRPTTTLEVSVKRSKIEGALTEGVVTLELADTLVAERGILAARRRGPAESSRIAAAAEPSELRLCVVRTTVLGPISTGMIHATDSLLFPDGAPVSEYPGHAPLTIADPQRSCLRFSRTPPSASWEGGARHHRCTHDLPMVIESRIDHADAGTLSLRSPAAILRGAEDRGEQGFGFAAARSLRVDNTRLRVDEYAPMTTRVVLRVRDGGP